MLLLSRRSPAIWRGESPYASHGLLTQEGVLRDDVPKERAQGIEAGFAWRERADATVVYDNLGMSRGMLAGIADARRKGHPVEFRSLGGGWAICAKIGSATGEP